VQGVRLAHHSAQRGTEYRTLAWLDTDLQQEALARRVGGHKVARLKRAASGLYGGRNARGDAYVLPRSSPEEAAILRRLGLTRLVDPRELRAALTPRSEFVSTEAAEVAEM
jgi:hypothetical protein